MQRGRRDLKQEDSDYFDGENGLIKAVEFLLMALLRGKERMITAANFDYYLDWAHPDFIDKLDEETKANPDKIGKLQSMHNVLCFLFDFLQFGFQYLVLADKVPVKAAEEKKVQNPTSLLTLQEDFQHPLRLDFYISGFDKLIRLVCDGIESICPQTDYLMRFWQIKHAENPSWAEDMFNEGRDSYERHDNYNVYGVLVFFALKIR